MAHFAQLDENNTVAQVIVVNNNELLDAEGKENEFRGATFCQSLFGADTVWYQTSYNGNFRKHYAGVGFKYDATLDAFIPPSPYPSWILNAASCVWEAPVAYPQDEKHYAWDEPTLSWIEVTNV